MRHPAFLRRSIFCPLAAGFLAAASLRAQPIEEVREANPSQAARESAMSASAELSRRHLSPEEIIARKSSLLAAIPRSTPVPPVERPPTLARPDLAVRSEPQRLRAEFSVALAEVGRTPGRPEEIVRRKLELQAANAETLRWADDMMQNLREPSPGAGQKSLDESPARRRLAAMMAEVRRRKASPENRIAANLKFQKDNGELFEAVKRNPEQPSALITK